MITLGLTGHIGSGKSLAAAYLGELGAAIINADKVGHKIICRGEKGYKPLLAAFGNSYLNDDGEFNRRALGEHIFNDASGKSRLLLNSITHPLIKEDISEQIYSFEQEGYLVVVIEAAVLFESELTRIVDKVWLISAPRNELIERVKKRDAFGEARAIARLNSQMAEEEMAQRADLVIVNNGTIEEFRGKLKSAYNKLLKESS